MFLYKFSNKQNDVLYIGKTHCLKQRFFQHKQDKIWWNEVDKIEIAEIHKFLVDIYEVYYINYFNNIKKLYNKKDINVRYTKFNLKNLVWEKYIEYD